MSKSVDDAIRWVTMVGTMPSDTSVARLICFGEEDGQI
jgi:hypothetical protein